jgi:hypothetical protein
MATYQIVRALRATTSIRQKLSMAAGSGPRLNAGGSYAHRSRVDVDTTTVHISACGIPYRRDKNGVSLVVVRAFDNDGKPVRAPG